jgi:glycosyltransferase involved in cell wall biosynthesis
LNEGLPPTLKVLAIASSGSLGGAELSLAEFVLRRPPHAQVEALLLGDGPLRERLTEQGVSTRVLRGYEGRPTARGLARFTRSLLRVLREARPDVVWATGVKAASLAVAAGHIARVPVVWHKVDFSFDALLARPLALAASGVVSVSEAVATPLGALRERRLLGVIGPPVRLPDELVVTPNDSEPTIGTLASLTPYKGHQHILEAAEILSGEFPRLRVLLAGPTSPDYPDYSRELKALIDRLGLAERVQFTGFVAEVGQVLGRLTVFVNATYRDRAGFGLEGLSGAMLEASWVGLPVVATRGGGTAEGIRDGVTGTLVEAADPAGLATALGRYLRDPELARRTGQAGQRFARERFAPAAASARLFEALSQVALRRDAEKRA